MNTVLIVTMVAALSLVGQGPMTVIRTDIVPFTAEADCTAARDLLKKYVPNINARCEAASPKDVKK